MASDLPAAHGTGPVWFAVDRAGHVASFFTNSVGAVPQDAARQDAASLPRLLADLQGNLFVYTYANEFTFIVPPYERTIVPAEPVHIDQLPPQLREAVGRLRLNSVRFSEVLFVQPWEIGPCVNEEGLAAYLSSDYSTIRPIPGYERAYAALYRVAKRSPSMGGMDVRYEELPKKQRAPRGKKKGKGGG